MKRWVWLLTFLSWSCGSSSAISPEEFCAEYASAVCAAIEECDCGEAFADDCEAEVACYVTDDRVAMRLANGSLVYDGAAARELIDQIRATDCSLSNIYSESTLRDFDTAFGILNGVENPGVRCVPDERGTSGCRDGYCDAETETCRQRIDLGETCGDDLHVCDSPVEGMPALCIEDICTTQLEAGESCSEDEACQSLQCDGTCQALTVAGEDCEESAECETGFCDSSTGRCAARISNGSYCTDSNDCASGACEIETGEVAGTCVAAGELGDACDTNDDCEDDLACVLGECWQIACSLVAPI